MKRVITSIKTAKKEILREISSLYPKGVEDDDLISLPTINGSNIRALEVELEDTLYLVKFEDEDYYRKYLAKDDDDDDDEDSSDSSSDSDEFIDADDIGDDEIKDEVDDDDDDDD